MKSAIALEKRVRRRCYSSMLSLDVTRRRSLRIVRRKAHGALGGILLSLRRLLNSAQIPQCKPSDAMPMLERFVVLMYDRTNNCLDVNSCRRDLFVKKGRAMEALQPTFAALLQHSCRAVYQAGHVWAQSLVQQQQLPPPED